MSEGSQRRRVGVGASLSLLGAGALIGSLWGTWFEYVPGSSEKLGVGRIPRTSVAEAEAEPLLSAWTAMASLDIVLLALALLGVAATLISFVGGARSALIVVAGAGATAAALAVYVTMRPAGVEMIGFAVDWGLVLGLAGALLMMTGASWTAFGDGTAPMPVAERAVRDELLAGSSRAWETHPRAENAEWKPLTPEESSGEHAPPRRPIPPGDDEPPHFRQASSAEVARGAEALTGEPAPVATTAEFDLQVDGRITTGERCSSGRHRYPPPPARRRAGARWPA